MFPFRLRTGGLPHWRIRGLRASRVPACSASTERVPPNIQVVPHASANRRLWDVEQLGSSPAPLPVVDVFHAGPELDGETWHQEAAGPAGRSCQLAGDLEPAGRAGVEFEVARPLRSAHLPRGGAPFTPPVCRSVPRLRGRANFQVRGHLLPHVKRRFQELGMLAAARPRRGPTRRIRPVPDGPGQFFARRLQSLPNGRPRLRRPFRFFLPPNRPRKKTNRCSRASRLLSCRSPRAGHREPAASGPPSPRRTGNHHGSPAFNPERRNPFARPLPGRRPPAPNAPTSSCTPLHT